MNARLAVIVLFISSVGWGLTWLPIKALNDMGLDSTNLILIAFASGAVVLSPWLYTQRRQWQKNIGIMMLIGLSGGIANASFQTAISHGDVVRVMILFYLLPVWSVLGGRIILGEKIDRMRMLSVLMCLSGAFLILDVWHTSWRGITWIDILAIASGMGLAITNILFRLTYTIPALSKIAFTFIGCTLIIGVSTLLISPQAKLPVHAVTIAWAMAYGALWLTMITIGTQWAVTRIEAGRSAVIIVMELVVAVVSVALISGESLKFYEIIGGLLVIFAALLEGMRSGEDELPASV
jgi:drug/metabolite transporter (DMT)-like permease